MARQAMKRLLQPLRTTAGRFIISPNDRRVTQLEAEMAALRRINLANDIFFKTGSYIAADKIPGDYLEFGVFVGGSFSRAYRGLSEAFLEASTPSAWNNVPADCLDRSQLWDRMRFFAFDSFEGLPSLRGVDTQTRDFAEGKFSCSEVDFKRNVSAQGVQLERVVTVPGWFDETVNETTFKQYNIQQAAVVNIDCDLYESARTVLEGITPILAEGTVIIFDDWFNYRGNPELGEQRACREWLAAHPEIMLTEYQKEGPWRNSFIVGRRSEGPA